MAKYILGERDVSKLKELWQWYMRSKNVNFHRRRPRAAGGGGGGGSSVRRAKITAVGSTTLTAKLVGADGNVITTGGDYPDGEPAGDGSWIIYPVEHLGTNNLSGDVYPKYAVDDYVAIFLDLDDKYYTVHPFDDTQDCL